jgi:hypothetical protein
MMLKLYADENVPAEVLIALRSDHDVSYAAKRNGKGKRDVWHLRRAADDSRILLTRDYNDFRLLHRIATALRVVAGLDVAHPGILTVVKGVSADRWAGAIRELVRDADGNLSGRFLACHEDGRWVEDTWRAS